MINELTQQQKSQINKYQKKWYDKFHSLQFDENKAKKFVDFLYKQIGKKPPIKIILDSPMACQLAINILKINKDSQLYSQLSSQLNKQLRSQLRSQLNKQLSSQLNKQLSSQLGKQLRSQLDEQLWLELSSQLDEQLWLELSSQLYSQLYSQLNEQLSSQLNKQLKSQLYSQLDEQLYSQLGKQLWSELDEQLWSELGSQLNEQLYSQLSSQLNKHLSSQLRSQLNEQLRLELSSQFDEQLNEQLRLELNEQLKKIKLENYFIDWWGDTSWYGYLAFYDFLYNIVFPEVKIPIFEQYIELCENISSLITFEGIAFISKPPTFVQFNKENKMHYKHDSAICFNDGWKLHYVEGVYFNEKLFNKTFKDKSITSEEILSISNAEQRAVIIKEYGFEYIFDKLEKKQIIDQQMKPFNKNPDKPVNYVLFECEIGNLKHKILKVEWWEKGKHRQTVLGVPNTMKDAIEAVAWTCHTTKDKWENKLIMEA